MILPQTYTGVLLLAILSLLCLGSWATFYKLAGKWRYEFFYLDFTFGLALAAVIAAFTIGSLGYDGFSVSDDLIHAGKRQWMFAFLAGVVFNLANMLLMAVVSLAGMAVAFPMTMGIGLTLTLLIGKLNGRAMRGDWLALGCVLVVLALVLDGLAYRSVMRTRRAALRAENKKRASRAATAIKGLTLAVVSGLIMAGMYPLLIRATPPEIGLGPFALTLLFVLGMFISTFVYSIFFMNLPVEGEPVDMRDYIRSGIKVHILGLIAGFVWCAGMLCKWVAGTVPPEIQVDRNVALALFEGGFVLAAIWGVVVWKDFREASGAAKGMAVLMLLLLAAGLVVLSFTLGSIPRST